MAVVVEEHVAVTERDEPDTISICRLRGNVALVATWAVIMRQHEHVEQSEPG